MKEDNYLPLTAAEYYKVKNIFGLERVIKVIQEPWSSCIA